MRIEALCTGDELLTGVTTDTNSTWFQERLLLHGEQVARTTVVGDVREEILEALRTLSARADVVLVSGGLGPTVGRPDRRGRGRRPRACGSCSTRARWRDCETRFARRGLTVTENNIKQVMVPEGAEVVLNPAGSAPMFVLRLGKAVLFFVPGVPREYRALVDDGRAPGASTRCRAERGETGFRALRLLKTVFLPESHLDARVRPLLPTHPRVTFGFRTHFPENHLKLMAEGRTEVEAREVLEAGGRRCAPAAGGATSSGSDDETMAGVVGQQLRDRARRLPWPRAAPAGASATC